MNKHYDSHEFQAALRQVALYLSRLHGTTFASWHAIAKLVEPFGLSNGELQHLRKWTEVQDAWKDRVRPLSPKQIDIEEARRITRLRTAAKNRGNEIRLSDAQSLSSEQARGATFKLNLGTRQLGLTREGIADLIQRRMHRRAAAQAHADENPGVQHVKDGKPLTALGAKLLNVPWSHNA